MTPEERRQVMHNWMEKHRGYLATNAETRGLHPTEVGEAYIRETRISVANMAPQMNWSAFETEAEEEDLN